MSGQISQPYLTDQLASLLSRPVPQSARERAVLHLVDWLGCAVAGSREQAGKILMDSSDADARSKAFVWGGLGNILEMDDVDKRAILHPGPSIIPAILAHGSDHEGADVLSAIVRGYEATIRLGRAVGQAHYAMWHSTGTCGAIGAAAGVASALNLGADQMAHALSLALSQSAGLWQTRHETASMGKQLHCAQASRAGLEAAELAARGFRGPLSILEGDQGFFAAMCADGDASDIMADFGADWLIHDVSFKPWPACRHAHAAIDAALLARTQLGSELIQKITVETYTDALKFCDKPDPQSVIEAKFSLQHAVAVALVRGAPKINDFSDAAIAEPDLSEMRKRVHVKSGEAYQSVYPAHFGARLSIVTDAGEVVFGLPDALGDPENPLSGGDIEAKARGLFAHAGLRPDLATELIGQAEALTTNTTAAKLATTLAEALAWQT